MTTVIQKFGGTSVATAEKIKRAAGRAIAARQRGDNVVVVVSARGKTTDELVAMAREITDRPAHTWISILGEIFEERGWSVDNLTRTVPVDDRGRPVQLFIIETCSVPGHKTWRCRAALET